VNSPQMYPGTPWGGLVAGFCEVVAAARPRADVELIRRACDVAARCHQGQTRYSGDPYITHPVAVATILARLEEIDAVDDQTLCVALLHDTVEDTPYSLAALRCDFGAGIAAMVTEHMALDRLDGRRGRTVRSQLQALAQAALIRNRPSYPSRRRVIVALDIERSTTRPDPVKADLRTMLYELFDAALRSAGVQASCRGPFIDRGDGLLALIDPVDQARVLNHAVPAFSQLLAGYNASLPDRGQRQLRVRAVMHAGDVSDDDNGCYGEALDIAFRLLDAPRVKTALQASHGPLVLVISGDVYSWVLRDAPRGTGRTAFHRLVTAQVAGNQHQGWIHFAPAAVR